METGAEYRRARITSQRSRPVSCTVAGQPLNAPSVVSKVLTEQDVSLTTNHLYTIIEAGYFKIAPSPKAQFFVIDDVLPTTTAAQVSYRIFNSDPAGPIDVYVVAGTATTGGVTGTPIATNVAFGSATPWINVPVATGTNVHVFRVTRAGSTVVLGSGLAPAGVVGVAQTASAAAVDPVAGARVAPSALTAVFFPAGASYRLTNPAVNDPAGTGANAATIAAPAAGVSFVVDVNPPRLSP